jgi:hypothetical protein
LGTLVCTVFTIQGCHLFINFISFHTHWPQKSDHRLLFFGAFYQCSSHVKYVTVLSPLKGQWKSSWCKYKLFFPLLPTLLLR